MISTDNMHDGTGVNCYMYKPLINVVDVHMMFGLIFFAVYFIYSLVIILSVIYTFDS